MTPAQAKPVRFADLGLRLASGVALAAIALVDVWMGGLWVVALVALALVLMLWEFHSMVSGAKSVFAPALILMAASGLIAIYATWTYGFQHGLVVMSLGVVAMVFVRAPHRGWLAAVFIYMGVSMLYLIILREREPMGLWLIVWLVVVVVAADVGAYFVGRVIGGAKLWPAVSPGKTWSGAIGGLFFAGLVGLAVGTLLGWNIPLTLVFSLGTAVASQLGDLLESAVKRRFGVKDSSRLIPGHGGVMDRLDGVMGGVWFFAICDALLPGAVGY